MLKQINQSSALLKHNITSVLLFLYKYQNRYTAVRVKKESPNTYEDIDKVIKDILKIKYKGNI
jgi:hypothetical protein